jgi:hypothetical protein
MSNITVNVTNAGAANVAVSNGSTVNATVGNGGAVNVSLGTISPGNATVVSGTLTINSTTTLAAGTPAYVKNDAGTAYAAKLDIGIPAGPATNVVVGNTTTLAAGSNATVSGVTNGSTLTLAFGIPAGTPGQNGSNGTNGTNGTNGITPTFSASATTLSAGSDATVTATTSNGGANVALAFGIPAGATGGSNLTLSDAAPSALGTAAAGTSNTASRSDHVHLLPSLSTLGAAAANHGHDYVTSLNNLTGGVTLAAGGNVTISSANSTLTIAASGGLGSDDAVDGGTYQGYIPQNTITITQQPTAQTASNGAATFSVSATSTPGGTLSYQWQKQESGAGSFSNIAGATSYSLALTGLTNAEDNGDVFRVVLSASNAVSVTSSTAALTVNGSGWAQVGSSLSGPSSSALGRVLSLSSDGTVLVAGDYNYNSESGLVRAYSLTNGAWSQRGADLTSENAKFGWSLSLSASGSAMAVGKNSSGSSSEVRFYDWNGTSWSMRGAAIATSSLAPVRLSDNGLSVVVGEPGHDDGFNTNIGRVRVFDWSGTAWEQRGASLLYGAEYDSIGQAVSMSGNGGVIAVASVNGDAGNTGRGDVRVFAWSGTSWVQRGASIEGESAGDMAASLGVEYVSVDLSVDGSVLAIGAIGNDGAGSNSGSVRVFAWSGTAWVQRGSDIDGQEANDLSGTSLSLSDDGATLAVASAAGPARVFVWSGSAWSQRGTGLGSGGLSVSLSSTGSTVAAQTESGISVYQWN